MSENTVLVEHPAIQAALTQMRARDTPPSAFRQVVHRIAMLLAAEATRDLPLATRAIETPLETIAQAPVLARQPVIVSILRAGNGMVDGVLDLFPDALVGHIGLFRNARLEAVEYYFRMPEQVTGCDLLVVDPMIATAGTAVAALYQLARLGPASVRLLAIVAAPEGLRHLEAQHPTVRVYVAAIDRELNDQGYILPGLGDAGDRLYGTLY